MADADLEKKARDYNAARERIIKAAAALEDCKRLIAEFAAHLDQRCTAGGLERTARIVARSTRSGFPAGVHVTQCGSPHDEITAPFRSVMLMASFSPVSFSASAAIARNTVASISFSVTAILSQIAMRAIVHSQAGD
jgi:hypothetical protein